MLLIDDYTRMTWVAFLKEKSKAFKELVENEENIKLKCLRSDNGGEFTSNEFNEFCETHGIKRKFASPKTPQQNGVVERKKKTIQEATRICLMKQKFSMDIGEN